MEPTVSIPYLERTDTALASMLNTMFDGVYIADRDRRILFWNKGAEAITGYSADEVCGRHCRENFLNHLDENGRLLCTGACPLACAMETGECIRHKVYALHKSGRRFPIMTHIAPIHNGDGEVIAGIEVFRDISREEELRLLQEKLNSVVQRYVSQTTYEEMLAQAHSGAAATVQVRDLTVFYLDIVNFTGLSERQTPEEMVRILNDVFGMCDVITRERHGDIDKFLGDAIMAIFIDANDAVEAGADILHGALPHFNALRAKDGLEPIKVRIGINSGRVVQADVGTSDRKDLTVIGDVVNAAQRIETMCQPGHMLISEATYSRLRKEVAALFHSQAAISVRGRAEPIRVFTSGG